MTLRVDLQLNGEQVSMAQLVDYARAAEAAGFRAVWTGEAFRDALVAAAAAAVVTERIGVGTNLAQWTRTPASLERAAADLQELAAGRFVLGLGPMPREWNERWHGIPWQRPVARMREYVATVRALWTAGSDQPVTVTGDHFRVEGYTRLGGPLAAAVPIHLGATGPAMARLAGEVADGVHFNALLSPEYLRAALLPAVAEGARRAARAPGEVARAALVITAVDADPAAARARARRQIAFYLGVTTYFTELVAYHGFGDAAEAVAVAFREGDIDGASAKVPDAMVSEFALAGSPDEVRAAAQRFDGVVDSLILYAPAFRLTAAEVGAGHAAILDAFADPSPVRGGVA